MAIAIMVVVAYCVKPYVPIEVIIVAPNYSVTNSTARGWFINPFDGSLSIVAGFAAFIPAVLVRLVLLLHLYIVYLEASENIYESKFSYFDFTLRHALSCCFQVL